MDSRIITHPDIDENTSKRKFLIVNATRAETAILINQLVKHDPKFDFYVWSVGAPDEEWLSKVWKLVEFALVNKENALDLTNKDLDAKKVVKYNNLQELFKFIYDQ